MAYNLLLLKNKYVIKRLVCLPVLLFDPIRIATLSDLSADRVREGDLHYSIFKLDLIISRRSRSCVMRSPIISLGVVPLGI